MWLHLIGHVTTCLVMGWNYDTWALHGMQLINSRCRREVRVAMFHCCILFSYLVVFSNFKIFVFTLGDDNITRVACLYSFNLYWCLDSYGNIFLLSSCMSSSPLDNESSEWQVYRRFLSDNIHSCSYITVYTLYVIYTTVLKSRIIYTLGT